MPVPTRLLNAAGNAVAERFHNGKVADFFHLNPAGARHMLAAILAHLPTGQRPTRPRRRTT